MSHTPMAVDARVRVRYAETDQMGVVYHANYLVWMEVGRVEYCRSTGMSYREMEQDGVLLMVAEAHCRFKAPAQYDEEIIIRTCIAQADPRLVCFNYELESADSGQKIATGYTKHIFCSRDRRPAKLPEKYHAAFGITRVKFKLRA